jgi:predicted Zn-ribbon and HTH transcriptional regulator
MIITMKKQCKKCGYEWESRIEEPKVCPYCKQYDWNKQREEKENGRN